MDDQTQNLIARTAVPSFPEWLEKIDPHWTWSWPHQRHIYRRLRLVTSGKLRRLMIFLPPRHSKSETVTVRYAAWRLIRDPSINIIIGSYNQKLANRFSRKVRRVVDGRIALSRERNAADEWETALGGGIRAVGVGAGVTGFGASLIIIDDPVKNRAEAESKAYRDRVCDWFSDDIYTRLEPRAAIVLIQTRWHTDDLAGRLTQQMAEGGEKWSVVRLPALAETNDPLGRAGGEALCPDRFSAADLERVRRQLGTYSFSALYQQQPVPGDGGLFKRSWFGNMIDAAPRGLRWVRGYDLAVSTRTSADYTASVRCAFDQNGNLYLADGFRGRIEYPEQRRYVLARMAAESRTAHAIENALHATALVQDIRREASALAVRAPLRTVRVGDDKYTRALGWAHLAEGGQLFLVRGPWVRDFIDEACSFPFGRHDDQIDAVSVAVRELAKRRTVQGF